ncbi:metal-sensing transcriptional repressor [Clostridium sp. Marseille-QA1073]
MHNHNHPQQKNVINRLSRAIGHLEGVKRMAEEGRDCSELLIQISAVRSAINNIGKIILEDHINHCVIEAIETNNTETLNDFKNALDKFLK